LVFVAAAFLFGFAGTTVVRADNCPITNAIKWIQYPDRKGLDVLAARAAGTAGAPLILADDFPCRQTGPITDIHIWASWLGDTPNTALPITLSFWSDLPGASPSRPGTLLWRQTFQPGQYELCALSSADELFWTPDPPPGQILGPDKIIWQYNFYPSNPFTQTGSVTAPIVYWLSVTAGTNTAAFGWKTATNQWNDAGVFGHLLADGITAAGDWQPLYDPRTPGQNKRLDLAFALTTRRTVPPPPPPPSKWVQYPDTNGFDINATLPNIVADDFQCTNASTLTNIQIWASWQDDANPNTNMTFVLGIWTDVPGGSSTGTVNGPSHPGSQLWTETFPPGSYPPPVLVATGQELFYSPTTGQLVPETKVWKYSFTPRRPYCQTGSPNRPVTYWLSVYGRNPNAGAAAPFGWKTSTNHWNDDAVYGHLTATGVPIGDWKELIDPRVVAAHISLDMAFLINNGPPGPDCDPTVRPKWIQLPNITDTGLDVLANYTNVLGDDFLCRVTGPINGITVWGSWLTDKVDPNVRFQLSLWTDVPTNAANTFSHPGELLCSTLFSPPNAVGTSLQRYKVALDQANLRESFYDPNIPGTAGIIGNDTQLWRYDFYPFYPGCWFQQGGTATTAGGLGRTYWLALTALVSDQSTYRFGWKTSTNHWNDDGVFGHYDSTGNPLKDWKDLHDPRTGQSLDLSFALRAFPITGINKDLRNNTGAAATGIQIVLSGTHVITWHYDDSPAWPSFSEAYVAGNTVLTWTGKTVAPGALTHVGFEMGGSGAPPIIAINWLSGTSVIPTHQLCFHFLGNASTLVTHNCFFPGTVTPANGTIEFFDTPPGLDQMLPAGQRTPLATFTLPVQPQPLPPGAAMRIPIPPGPSNAMYAMLTMNLMDEAGSLATTDFVLIPLDMAMRPMIHGSDVVGPDFTLRFFSIPDRIYHVQGASDLRSGFFDIFPEISGTGEEISVPLPTGATQGFYRIMLEPE
jgi:hypothetical protein